MGLKNLFNRKTKKPEKHNATETAPSETLSRANSTNSRAPIEDQLEHVFKKFDVNGDGKISSSELGTIMESLGQKPTETELDNLGFIDLKQFIALNTEGVDLLENIKDAFSVFDVDKNGEITADELQHVLRSLGEECSVGECRKMIAAVDRDGDGNISFEEFKVMMINGSRFRCH